MARNTSSKLGFYSFGILWPYSHSHNYCVWNYGGDLPDQSKAKMEKVVSETWREK